MLKRTVSSLFILFVFQFFQSLSCNQDDESNIDFNFLSIDHSNYVDPHDILNYDRRVNKEIVETPKTVDTEPRIDITSAENLVSNLPLEEYKNTEDLNVAGPSVTTQKLKTEHLPEDILVKSLNSNNSCSTSEKPFLGRFIKILSKTLELEVFTKYFSCSYSLIFLTQFYLHRINISMMEMFSIFPC